MCVICKQARRSGRAWSGMEGCWLPTGVGPPGRDAGPPLRCGKRAFVRAVPQLVGNVRVTQVGSYNLLTSFQRDSTQSALYLPGYGLSIGRCHCIDVRHMHPCFFGLTGPHM
jgi:hypothetical protein